MARKSAARMEPTADTVSMTISRPGGTNGTTWRSKASSPQPPTAVIKVPSRAPSSPRQPVSSSVRPKRSLGEAPTAFISPNSRSRSTTDIVMALSTPRAPMNEATRALSISRMRDVATNSTTVERNCVMVMAWTEGRLNIFSRKACTRSRDLRRTPTPVSFPCRSKSSWAKGRGRKIIPSSWVPDRSKTPWMATGRWVGPTGSRSPTFSASVAAAL